MLDKIKELCRERNITIAELERQACLTPKTLANWKESIPSVDKVAKVAKVLGVTIEELLEDESENGVSGVYCPEAVMEQAIETR